MLGVDAQKREAAVAYLLRKVGRAELAERLFDGDLPHGCRTDVDVEFLVEAVLDLVGKGGIVRKPPQHDVRVEEKTHRFSPKSSAMPSLTSGESQSSEVTILPCSEPLPDLTALDR